MIITFSEPVLLCLFGTRSSATCSQISPGATALDFCPPLTMLYPIHLPGSTTSWTSACPRLRLLHLLFHLIGTVLSYMFKQLTSQHSESQFKNHLHEEYILKNYIQSGLLLPLQVIVPRCTFLFLYTTYHFLNYLFIYLPI